MAFDTKTNQVLWWDTLVPKEGCRCLAFDEERGLLYAVTYPLDHLISYDVRKRKRRDLGRIGSVNAQALFLDKKHRVWTSSDYGRLVRYSPDKDRLELSPNVLPHNPSFQTGWHSVFYDAVAAPDRESVFASTWIATSLPDAHLGKRRRLAAGGKSGTADAGSRALRCRWTRSMIIAAG